MTRWTVADPTALAATLDQGTIDVWQLPYRRAQARAPLLALLAGYLGRPAETIALTTLAYGRPVLDHAVARGLDFNWSHSGEHALVALARGVVPGIDLERIRPRRNAMEIAKRYFAPDEHTWLQSLPSNAARERAFLQPWTAKEAVLKAQGRGLAFGLDRLSIDLAADQPSLVRLAGETSEDWQLQALDLQDDYLGALAWRGEPRRIRRWLLAVA